MMVLQSYFELSFPFLFYGVVAIRLQLSCGKSVKYRLIEFFVFDCGVPSSFTFVAFVVRSPFSPSCS